MLIRKLNIEEYGALREREFTLSKGMNIFEGNNESGKSTILSFIRFMLYGMPRKSAGNVTERDRGISWSGGVAGGSMEVSILDKSGLPRDFRIERHGQLRGATGHENYTEVVKIIDLATGTEVFEGQEPGRALLGLSQETYVSTACIRQLECTNVDGTGVNASIENLLFAANEGINTEKATAKLDDMRKALLHKNGKGGELFELEAQKLILEEKLTHAKEAAETIIAKESAVEALGILESDIGAKMRECEDAITLYENCTVLRRFDELHAREDQVAKLESDLKTLSEEKGYAGDLPDRQTIADAEALVRGLSEASTNTSLGDTSLIKAQNAPDGDRKLSEHAETVEAEGGHETLEADFARLWKKQSKDKGGAIASLIFGILILLTGAMALLCGLSFETPLLSIAPFVSLTEAVEQSVLPIFAQNATLYLVVSIAILVIGLALTVLGILLFVSSKSAMTARMALVDKVGLSGGTVTAEAFAAHLTECIQNRELCLAHDEGVEQATIYAAACHSALRNHIEKCCSALSVYGVECDPPTPETVAEALHSTINILSALCREKERLENEIGNLRTVIASMEEGLGGYNENALRSAIGTKDPAEVLSTTDIGKVEMTQRYYKEQLAAATAKRIGMEKELIALTAASENPAKLAARLDEITAELEEKKFRHQSLIVAIEAIDSASDSLRRSVTPRIREKAGILMGRITDGKYNELGVSADMSVNVFAGNSTRSIDVLSKGTKDAAYLSLRIALADLVSPGNPLPLTMDEGLSLLDEERAARVLALLYSYTQNGGQCILFTCHKREGVLLRELGDFKHIILS